MRAVLNGLNFDRTEELPHLHRQFHLHRRFPRGSRVSPRRSDRRRESCSHEESPQAAKSVLAVNGAESLASFHFRVILCGINWPSHTETTCGLSG